MSSKNPGSTSTSTWTGTGTGTGTVPLRRQWSGLASTSTRTRTSSHISRIILVAAMLPLFTPFFCSPLSFLFPLCTFFFHAIFSLFTPFSPAYSISLSFSFLFSTRSVCCLLTTTVFSCLCTFTWAYISACLCVWVGGKLGCNERFEGGRV